MNIDADKELLKKLTALAADSLHEQLISQEIFRSCITCNHFISKSVHCKVYEEIPPPHIIVFSCKEKWEPIIPF